MKSLTWKRVAAVAGGVSGVGALVAAVFACSSSSVPPPPPSGAAAGQCSAPAGQFPAPNCLTYPPDAGTCSSTAITCNTMPCSSSSPCLAMGADNSGKSIADMRIRRLDLAAPASLATQTVQKVVINQGINLNNACGESGDGTFSWLIQFDTSSGKLTTGGAPPTTDPFNVGYCFVNKVIDGLSVQAISVNMTKGSDGTWSSDLIPKLYVPIYPPGLAPIVLPISGSKVKNVTLSPDNNCIGSYNPNAITAAPGPNNTACTDDITSCDRWITAGSLGGYITLEEADKVLVPQLSESLCVLLTPNTPPDVSTNPKEKLCQRMNGQIVAKGDYCSTSNSPGGCADSFWLAASFAASAAKISATPNQADCMGGGGDGGTGPTDAGGQ